MPVQELLADKEVILAAVEQNGELLDFASEEPCREGPRKTATHCTTPAEQEQSWDSFPASGRAMQVRC